jgi:DNA-binding transcriptional MerR regulator
MERFYTITEAARIAEVKPYVLRYWEQEFPELRTKKSTAGRRIYSQADLDLILKIKGLLYRDGYTIKGAKRKLSAFRELARAEEPLSDAARRELLGWVYQELLEIKRILEE